MTGAIVTRDPSTGEELERIPYFNDEQIETALARAEECSRRMRATPLRQRAAFLRAYAAALRDQATSLASIAVREMGKPIVQARAEIEKCAWCCEYFADHAAAMLAERTIATGAARSFVAFRPLGPILAIMPWNFPYWQFVRSAAPAIAAGNPILLKHAAITTRCGLEIERIAQECAGEDYVQTLLIDDERADELIADRRIAAVTLTGSERAGVAVAQAAGRALKKCVLELGGSDAYIVLRDADLPSAVDTAVKARFQNTGQSCIAAKRFIVEHPVYGEFVARFAEAAAAQNVGDPLDETTQIGPCARADLRDALQRQVAETVAQGACVVTGGRAIERPGYYFEPTVVRDVAPGTPMFTEETFGPAAAICTAKDAEHAIALANDSTFGLGCNIWTSDIEHAQQLAARIEAGSVFINGMVASDPRLPFGGVKRSGYGRELSDFGIHEFVNIQTVWIGPQQQTPAE